MSTDNLSATSSNLEIQSWISEVKGLEEKEDYEKALIQSLSALKLACSNVDGNKDSKKLNILSKRIVLSATKLLQLSDNFHQQGFLNQLFALAYSFHQQPNLELAINFLETAIEFENFNRSTIADDNLTTDQILMMKVYYELACCNEEKLLYKRCVSDFTISLQLAVQHNDIPFEKMILLRMSNVLMELNSYEEAISNYMRLLAICEDFKETFNGETLQFRAHWTVESECEIHYNLCVAYMKLHLYEKAVIEGCKFKNLLKVLTDIRLVKPRLKNHPAVTHTMQINSILGSLYELLEDFSSAHQLFCEWLDECKSIIDKEQNAGLPLHNELIAGYEAAGRMAMKLNLFAEASECFSTITRIGQANKSPRIEIVGTLLHGDLMLAMGNYEEAGSIFARALKLAQTSIDDGYATECKCMAKEAQVLAAQHRYAHALYRCEQALTLGQKLKTSPSELQHQAAIYSQHSTSEKELLVGLKFLVNEISLLEEKLQLLKSEGASRVVEDERIVFEDYVAIQVILCRLGENKLSLAFGESAKSRPFFKAKNQSSVLPTIENKGVFMSNLSHVCVVDSDQILLPDDFDVTILAYTLTDTGLLSHFVNSKRKLIKSYLSADHVIDSHLIETNIRQLVKIISEKEKSNATEKFQVLYNIENRNLPEPGERIREFAVPLPKRQKCIQHEIGDKPDVVDPNNDLKLSKCLLEKGDACESHLQKEGVDTSTNTKPRNPFKELYSILIQPFRDVIQLLPSQSQIFISVEGLLARIPFEQLINPTNEKALGETFDVIITPCLHLINPSSVQKGELCKQSGKGKQTRRNQLLRSFVFEKDLKVLEEVGFEKNFSGLVSSTASGTNVISSPQYVTPYRQAIFPDKACVIGGPMMPKSLQLNNDIWRPPSRLPNAQKECKKIAEYLDVTPIIGAAATKAEFLKQMKESTVLHVCTFGSISRGLLAFRPDSFPIESEPVSMSRYVVSLNDLLDLDSHQVKLIVLSSGQTWSEPASCDQKLQLKLHLVNVLLAAGVQAVVFPLWSVPDNVSETFYFNFYLKLQSGGCISKAVYSAKLATREKFSSTAFWNAFVAIGNDVTVNLAEFRDSDLHRAISGVESDKLNPSVLIDTEQRLKSYLSVQKALSSLCGHLDVSRDGEVLPFLLGLIEEATDRLAKDENGHRPVVIMPEAVSHVKGVKELLELAGFDFQRVDIANLPRVTREVFSVGAEAAEAEMIVFPHWNQDELLLPLHQALSGLLELSASSTCIQALSLMLPLTEEILCNLIDLLALLYHSPLLQLRITDAGTGLLWKIRSIRRFLAALGIWNVRSLIVFYRTAVNKLLLMGSLQLLLSFCGQRDRSILQELQLETLGKVSEAVEPEAKSLTSLKAVVMPRNESIPDLNVQYMSTRLFQSDVDLKSKNVALRRNPPSKQEANFQYSKREFVETPILSHIAGKKFFCTGGCRRPDKLFVTSSWMSGKDSVEENSDRKVLASSITEITHKYARILDHAKWWHQDVKVPKQSTAHQRTPSGNEKPLSPRKVKVQSGATPSCNRTPLAHETEMKPLNLFEVLRRRVDARNVLNKRCSEIKQRHASAIRSFYLPYVSK